VAPWGVASTKYAAVAAAMKQVANYLGNTPTVARSSYVDPRVIDLYEDGVTIAEAVHREYDTIEDRQQALEQAVCALLDTSGPS